MASNRFDPDAAAGSLQAFPDLDRVIQFLPTKRAVWATCELCGLGLRGFQVASTTAANARRHLDEKHPGWDNSQVPHVSESATIKEKK